MKHKLTLAASVAAVTLAAAGMNLAVFAPAFSQAPTVSKAVAKPLKAAQDAMHAKKYSEALARLKEVQAIPGKSAYDQYLVDEMMGFIAASTRNYAEAARALEAGLNSSYFEKSDVPRRVLTLAGINYQLKNYDKALEYGNRAIKGGYADDATYSLMAQTYYTRGDFRTTQRFVENYVNGQIKAGKKPEERYLQFISVSCDKLGDAECSTRNYERLVSYYPKPEYWQNLLSSILRAKQTDKEKLHVYRLASEVDILKQPDDYTEMAQLAQEEGSFGEAARILQQGFERKVFADERTQNKNKRLLAVIQSNIAKDRAALAKESQQAAAARTGDEDVSVGLAYFSYQQYNEAIAAFNRSLAKPLANTEHSQAEIRLLLGIAQLEAGKKDDAVKSFRAVKGDPKLERLASLWSLHARQA